MNGMSTDTSELELAVSTLRTSEDHYRLILQHSPTGILRYDNALIVTYCNDRLAQIIQVQRDRLVGMDLQSLDDQRLLPALRSALGGMESTYEGGYGTTLSGDPVWVAMSCSPFHGAQGRIEGGVAIIEDITERRRAERAIAESERKYRTLFETANDGIFLQDARGFLDCNQMGASMYGLSKEEVIGASPADLCPERQADGRLSSEVAAGHIERALRGETPCFEWQYLRSDGVVLDAEVTLSCIEYQGAPCLQAIVRDICKRKDIERQLLREHAFRQRIIEALPGIFFVFDASGQFQTWNRNLEEVVARSAEEIEQSLLLDLIDEDDRPLVAKAVRHALTTGRATVEAKVLAGDGKRVPYLFSVIGADLDGLSATIGLGIDITERKRAEEGLRLAASVFRSSQEGIMITDAENRIVDVNEAFTRITGFSRDEVLHKNPRLLQSGHHDAGFYAALWQTLTETGHWQGEVWDRRRDGELYASRLTISEDRDATGSRAHFVALMSDITKAKLYEERLEKIAHYDTLTGIPNRALLTDCIHLAIAQTRQNRTALAVCYLDLDGFKPINDTYGHEAGDQLLVEMAGRLRSCLRGGDTVARLGGDEFVLLLLGLDRIEEYEVALQRILDTIGKPVSVDGESVSVTASIGVTLYPQDDATPDTLLRHADQAMYQAKQRGKNRYQLFEPNCR